MGGFLKFIWDYFAIRRRRLYLAGCLIGLLAAVGVMIRNADQGLQLWLLPGGAVLGILAVWFILLAERLQARLEQDRAEGNPILGLQVLFVLLGLVGLITVALAVAGVFALYI